MLPCGTPDVTGAQSDWQPSITTRWDRPWRKLDSQERREPVMPKRFSLIRRRSWGTESKAFSKSRYYYKSRYKSSQLSTDFDENIPLDNKTWLITYVLKRRDCGNSFSLLFSLSKKWWFTMNKTWLDLAWSEVLLSIQRSAPATRIKVTTTNTHRYSTPKRPTRVFPIITFHSGQL